MSALPDDYFDAPPRVLLFKAELLSAALAMPAGAIPSFLCAVTSCRWSNGASRHHRHGDDPRLVDALGVTSVKVVENPG